MGSEKVNVSARQRDDSPLPAWGEEFLEALASKTVADACRQVGIDRSTPYQLRPRCPELRKRWAEIADARDDRMEDTLAERMADGWLEPVFDRDGNEIAQRRIYDNKTALAYLKARRPEKWSERRVDQGGDDGQRIEIVFTEQPATPPDTTKGAE